MSTLEEFEAALVGATAGDPDGRTAVKTPHKQWPWSLFDEDGERIAHASNHHMATQGWKLDPAPALPLFATARAAFEYAWDHAHPVQKGQIIPEGTDYIYRDHNMIMIRTAAADFRAVDEYAAAYRTFTITPEPEPEPTPDWLDAPALLARAAHWDTTAPRQVWVRTPRTDMWEPSPSELSDDHAPWQDLRDVTPLYPKETLAEAWEEGHEAAAMRVPEGVWHDTASPRTPNPYREKEQDR